DAVEAVRQVGRANSATDSPLVVRIGIAQGIVTRRRSAGGDYLMLGNAIEEARAVCSMAAAHRILLGGKPGRLAAAHYSFRELSPLRQRGRRIRVLELLGPQVRDERRRLLSTCHHGSFHGRRDEIETLLQAYYHVQRTGLRLTCSIVGEAGIGKTRLVAELLSRIADTAPWLVAVTAAPGDSHAPYALVCQVFRVVLEVSGRAASSRSRLLERFGKILDEREVPAEERDEALAALQQALIFAEGKGEGPLDSGTGGSGIRPHPELRDRMVAALTILLHVTGSSHTRIVFLEDFQWADGASVEVVKAYLQRPAHHSELVIIAGRQTMEGLTAVANQPRVDADVASSIIELKELPAQERDALIREQLGQKAHANESLVELVAGRAGGNPLFIQELVSAIRDLGSGSALPESARAVIAARVDRLPRAAKAVLQYAAVIGSAFRPSVLEALLGSGVGRALRLLEEQGFIHRSSEGTESGSRHSFRHGLLREVVYDALAGAARREAHRRIGLLGAERYEQGSAEPPAGIAEHLELGGEQTMAAVFYLRAGRLGLAAFDARAAVLAFTKALELGVGTDEPDRAREAISGREQALYYLGDHANQLADLQALERICTNDLRRLADVHNRAAMRQLRLGDYSAAIAATLKAEESAKEGGDERTRGEALRIRAEAFERRAELDRALDAVREALEIFRRIGARTEETSALIGMGRIHLMCNKFEAALANYLPALEHIRNSGDLWLERIVCNNMAAVRMCRGEYSEAFEHGIRAVDICSRYGDRPREGDSASICGSVLLEVGQYEEARKWLQAALTILAETGSKWSRADSLVYAGRCELELGCLDRALAMFEESLSIAAEIGARYVEANAHSQLSLAFVRRGEAGDPERAQRAATQAIELGRQFSLVAYQILGCSRLALARLTGGDVIGAAEPSTNAVALLEGVGAIEHSEEEICFTHYRVLAGMGNPSASRYLERAYAGFMTKLQRIEAPRWRRSFAEDVELHRQIVDEYAWTTQPVS
ncbi:MAG: tetratricopeptide repeat protein, partial [Pseudomonadota bacterium]